MEDKQYVIVDDNTESTEKLARKKIVILGHIDHGSFLLANPGLNKKIEVLSEEYDIEYCADKQIATIGDDKKNIVVIDDSHRTGFGHQESLFGHHHYKDVYELHNMHQYQDDFMNPVTKRMMNEPDAVPVRNSKDNPKIGRNDPCPCGSGKKNKNCCKYE